MSLDIINEAFKRLEFLDEDVFDLTSDGIRNLKNFMINDDNTETVSVIDPEAQTDEDLQDSYMGKIILKGINCFNGDIYNRTQLFFIFFIKLIKSSITTNFGTFH